MTQRSAEAVTVARGAGLIEADVDGQLVGLHVGNGTCYAFNPTATRIWELIERPRTLAAIVAALTEEFEIDPETCEADVRLVLADLATDGIVRLS